MGETVDMWVEVEDVGCCDTPVRPGDWVGVNPYCVPENLADGELVVFVVDLAADSWRYIFDRTPLPARALDRLLGRAVAYTKAL